MPEETSEETKEESINEDSQTDLESTTAQIAQIGETTYETLESAIQAAQNGEEIKLLEDIQLEEEMIIDTGQNVILNLNGKTISSTSLNTIVNNGILTITGTGIIRNEIENGTVIYNTGTLNLENGVITTNKNGGKAVQNVTENTSNSESNASANSNNGKTSGVFNMKAGKIVTEGIGSVGIYNGSGSKVTIEGGIIEVTGNGSKAIYNNADLEITGGKVIVSGEDAIGIYNGKTSKTCIIKLAKAAEANKAPEIIVEAEEIEHYDEIKNTDQFKEQLAQMKPSYGIYNDAETEIVIEAVTIQVERLKGVGIRNNTSGTITLGIEDETITTATPTINAVADNTTALQNSEKGQINFYDGNFVTLTSVKEDIGKIPKMSEIQETISKTIMKTILITTGDASQL